MKKILPTFNLLPFSLLVILFIITPLLWIVVNGFKLNDNQWGIDNFINILKNPFYLQAIWISIKVSFLSSVIGLLIGMIALRSLYPIRESKISQFILSFNSMISNFAGVPLAFAFMILIGNNGMLNLLFRQFGFENLTIDLYSITGILIIYIYFQIPLTILLLYPTFDAIKKEWWESASLLGAKKTNYLFQIILPILRPAILGTFMILFANALGAYATVYTLTAGNFNMIPIRIASLVSGDIFLNPYMASALSIVLIFIMLFVAVIHYLINRKDYYQKKV